MSACIRFGPAGNLGKPNSNAAVNYPLSADGKSYTGSGTTALAQFALLVPDAFDLSGCSAVVLSGADYATLATKFVSVLGSAVPVCLKFAPAGNLGAPSATAAINYPLSSDGLSYTASGTTQLAKFLLPDPDTAAIAQCAAVSISGSDYQALMAAANAPSSGGTTVGVSAEIFVGAALLLCFALGWIAGGQR